ncbi:A-kinase anchor protein SPHKAP-like isoform X2 [Anguilla rostrata]|uniref:A-kinase anchor protein SPHKAP-like isoform X2 n=1 Tax=Anguilla rostrata TaxID=7938 RepID=UPI0030D1F8B8
MLEVSEPPHTEGLGTETNLGTSTTACKKVQCSRGPLDSADFWSRNEKELCPIGFLEERGAGRRAEVCFVNLEQHDLTQKDGDRWTKALASISPSLPELVFSEDMQHLQESEVMLLSDLQSPKTCPSGSASHQGQRAASVCLVRGAGSRRPDGVAREVNRFLTGLASARERQSGGGGSGLPGRWAAEDAELSLSSVEEDFLSTSEHLGESGEGDPLQTDCGSGSNTETLQSRTGPSEPGDSQVPSAVTPDLLVPSLSQTTLPGEEHEAAPFSQSRSFKLPKIIIMQSTDSDEGTEDRPGSPTAPGQGLASRSSCPCPDLPPLVCAAAAAATTATSGRPWLRGPASPLLRPVGERQDFSLFPALCGVAQVAGAVALADLADADAAAGAEAFRANIARTLLGEAAAVLCRRDERGSAADHPRSGGGDGGGGANDAVPGTDVPRRGRRRADRFARAVADGIWERAAKSVAAKEGPEGPGGDVSRVQDALLESVNGVLFDVLCITAKRIADVSAHDVDTLLRQESVIHPGDRGASKRSSGETLIQLLPLPASGLTDTGGQSSASRCPDGPSAFSVMKKEECSQEEEEEEGEVKDEDAEMPSSRCQHKGSDRPGAGQVEGPCSPVSGRSNLSGQGGGGNTAEVKIDSASERTPPCSDSESCPSVRERTAPIPIPETKCSLLPPQLVVRSAARGELASPVSGFADDLAATVVSMATELAAIYLENTSGKQPWFCSSLKGLASKAPQRLLLPCRGTAGRRKEAQGDGGGGGGGGGISAVAKKHRPPRLSEIRRKAEEQPELMERLVNRVVDETAIPDEPPDAASASAAAAKVATCPELSVVDMSADDQPHGRLGHGRSGAERAAGQGGVPEEVDYNPSAALGPADRLGQDLSRSGSMSKQSSCESITDEFSRFMVQQMESEGRGFDLLLDYYAGKSASGILSAAVQQAAGKRSNGRLAVRPACVSKQSSTESITEEFYRFMLRDLDWEGGDRGGLSGAKEWSNTLLPPSPRTPFCVRQSSVPDRRSSDSRLTVNAPVKANSFDDFGRSGRRDAPDVSPAGSPGAETTGLCRSDSCLYRGRGQTDRITDALIHETWRGSIESLMRKNKIIGDEPEHPDAADAADAADGPGGRRPHVELFANRLVADIMESGKSSLGGRRPASVGERRRCFRARAEFDWSGRGQGGDSTPPRGSRDVPQIHIQDDQREQLDEDGPRRSPEETPHSPMSRETWDLGDPAKDCLENGEGGSGSQMELLVMNFDLGGECVDGNLRATLQWIAATELGLPAICFQKAPGRTDKFQEVVQLVTRRGWTVGRLFCAVVHFCEAREARADFMDWLLERLRP